MGNLENLENLKNLKNNENKILEQKDLFESEETILNREEIREILKESPLYEKFKEEMGEEAMGEEINKIIDKIIKLSKNK